ncbi:MAG: hypothetical protein IPM82_11070 [Saprospiraceae bacterium]|nr:hypothetical protein [Saprospiraceae bacterium]
MKEKQMQQQQTSQTYEEAASAMPDFEEKKVPKKQEILDLLANGDVDKAIKELRVLMPEDNTVLNLTSQYNRLKRERQQGIISNENANLTNNQIVNSLIQIARKLPDDMGDEAGNANTEFDDNSTYVYIEYASVK